MNKALLAIAISLFLFSATTRASGGGLGGVASWAMYGYNAAIAVAGNSQYNKLFYGPSVGAYPSLSPSDSAQCSANGHTIP